MFFVTFVVHFRGFRPSLEAQKSVELKPNGVLDISHESLIRQYGLVAARYD